MQPKTEEFLNLLLWSADMLARPIFRNLTDSYESWAYRNGLMRQVAILEQQQLLERDASAPDDRFYHYGAERRESGEQKAARIVAEELERLDWTEEQLDWRQKGDAGKARIARRLREETTMTLKWIAARLRMGKWTHVSNLLATSQPDQQQLILNSVNGEDPFT